jgi:hypothetical protein
MIFGKNFEIGETFSSNVRTSSPGAALERRDLSRRCRSHDYLSMGSALCAADGKAPSAGARRETVDSRNWRGGDETYVKVKGE